MTHRIRPAASGPGIPALGALQASCAPWILLILVLLAGCAPLAEPKARTADVVILPVASSVRATPTATFTPAATLPAAATATIPATETIPAAAAASRTPVPSRTPTAAPVPTGGEKRLVVRIAVQRVYAYEGALLVFDFPVSTGRNQNTATGRFKILDKHASAVNVRWNYRMPHWMGVYWVNKDLENGFHALPLLPDGSRLWAEQIGTPASDGCIVLLPEDMARLYAWAEVGTPVLIED